jgi:hypothetical protein
MAEPTIIIWDLETSHNVQAAFSLLEEYVPYSNIIQERFIVCASWKELGSKRVESVSILDDKKRFSKDASDDYHVCKVLHEVLSKADACVAHNGNKFDLKMLEGRFLYHGLGPLPPLIKIDTLTTARSRFRLNANNLDYLGKYLGVGRKIKVDNELWLDVLKGDAKAIEKMVVYNKQDVLLLEKVFMKLRPWMSDYLNRELFGGIGCPRCGSTKVQSRGTHKAISRVYKRFQCQNPKCMGWFREMKGTTNVKSRVL